jgi:hypothetical protein
VASAADAVGYGESTGMRVDVVAGWRTSRTEDRWRRRMMGDNVSLFDVDVTVWTPH